MARVIDDLREIIEKERITLGSMKVLAVRFKDAYIENQVIELLKRPSADTEKVEVNLNWPRQPGTFEYQIHLPKRKITYPIWYTHKNPETKKTEIYIKD